MLNNINLPIELRKKLSLEVFDVLSKHEKYSDSYEIDALIGRWYAAKKPLIDKLRQHPN